MSPFFPLWILNQLRNKTKILLLVIRLIMGTCSLSPWENELLKLNLRIRQYYLPPRSSYTIPAWDVLGYDLSAEMGGSEWLWDPNRWWSWQGLLKWAGCGWWRRGGKPGRFLRFQSGELGGCGAIYRDRKVGAGASYLEGSTSVHPQTERQPTNALLDHIWSPT